MIPRPLASSRQSVLIVDQSEETRQVLRTVLMRRGLRIFEADEARGGLELARRHHPGVIVLDLESESADDVSVRSGYDAESSGSGSSLVVLGAAPTGKSQPAGGRVVSKPYHFAPLIRTIVELLDVEPAAEQIESGG